jgi:hypothetical protein
MSSLILFPFFIIAESIYIITGYEFEYHKLFYKEIFNTNMSNLVNQVGFNICNDKLNLLFSDYIKIYNELYFALNNYNKYTCRNKIFLIIKNTSSVAKNKINNMNIKNNIFYICNFIQNKINK